MKRRGVRLFFEEKSARKANAKSIRLISSDKIERMNTLLLLDAVEGPGISGGGGTAEDIPGGGGT